MRLVEECHIDKILIEVRHEFFSKLRSLTKKTLKQLALYKNEVLKPRKTSFSFSSSCQPVRYTIYVIFTTLVVPQHWLETTFLQALFAILRWIMHILVVHIYKCLSNFKHLPWFKHVHTLVDDIWPEDTLVFPVSILHVCTWLSSSGDSAHIQIHKISLRLLHQH